MAKTQNETATTEEKSKAKKREIVDITFSDLQKWYADFVEFSDINNAINSDEKLKENTALIKVRKNKAKQVINPGFTANDVSAFFTKIKTETREIMKQQEGKTKENSK